MSKPTVVLIPGAWHSPSHYAPLLNALEALGYPTKSLRQPGVSPDDYAYPTLEVEVAFAREQAILPELEKNNVIVIGHSYGGAVLGAAVRGLAKEERKEGQNAVLGLVFIAAMLGTTGQTLLPNRAARAPFIDMDDPETGLVMSLNDPEPVLYNGIDDRGYIEEALRTLGTQSWQVLSSPSPPQVWGDNIWDGRRVYIKCLLDRTLPIEWQDQLINLTKVEWEILTLNSGHSPFVSHVKEMTDMLEKWAAKWQ